MANLVYKIEKRNAFKMGNTRSSTLTTNKNSMYGFQRIDSMNGGPEEMRS